MTGEKYPNVSEVRAQARKAWEKEAKKRIGIQERIGASIPWWLVIIAVVFFTLSAPHTARVFEMLTPSFGYIAPIGIEFGLLYTSFRRKKAHEANGKVSISDWSLNILLFLTSIIANGVGSLIAVVDNSNDIQHLSVTLLYEQFGNLPATNQVALFLVPMAALIIPVGTIVAGEGLAALFLESRRTGDLLEERWRDVSAEIEFLALRDAAIATGITPVKAIKWAAQIVGSERPSASASVRVSATDRNRTETGQPDRTMPDRGGHGTGQGYTKQMSAREQAKNYLEENPDARELSARELASVIGIGKTVSAEILQEFRGQNNHNGHRSE